jgi:phosphohistidine phosphatase
MVHHEGMEQAPDIRHLWILRHAKAVPESTWGGRDRDRTLTERGRRDATALGLRLATGEPFGPEGLEAPGLAICSSAARAQETADLVLAASEERVALDVFTSLYQAAPDTVLTYLREVDEHARAAMVIGHNPTMYQLTWELLAEGSDDRDVLEARGFPTCGLAVLELHVGGWEDLAPGCATLAGLFAPPY